MFLGRDTPGPEFRENSRERGPRSPANRARGFDPPWGAHARRRGGRARAHPGAGRSDPWGGGHTPGRTARLRATRAAAFRRAHEAGRGGGFRRAQAGRAMGGGAADKRAGAFGRARRACGGRGGAGRPFPGGGVAPAAQGRTGPNPAGRAGGRGGGFSGGAGTRWAAAGPRSGGGGKGGSFCAGVCRVIAPARGGGRKKAAFSHIRKRVFRPLFFVGSELFLPENLVLFIGLLFRPRRAMNVSRAGKGEDRRPGAAAAGGKSRRAQGRKPSEKPDFRHRD